MDMEEVLLQKLIQQASDRNTQASLGLEKVDVLCRNVGQVADDQERIVGVDNVWATNGESF
jgi:hypothetical protein